jgi:predicted DCC family thiol-disulfide oxidoreductase YuxK
VKLNDHPVVLFDGYCRFCHATVRFLNRHDRKRQFRFATLDSKFATNLAATFEQQFPDTVILYYQNKLYFRSNAVLKILEILGGRWQWTCIAYLFPLFLRDAVYKLVAAVRYRLWGKYKTCPLPPQHLSALFLD